MKIFYYWINYVIIEIKILCEVCAQKNFLFYKRLPCQQIILKKPKDRIILDITFLPQKLIKNNEYKYLLNCIEHFTKFVVSYLIKKNLLLKFNILYSNYGENGKKRWKW